MRRLTKHNGFTLLELLVVFSLMVLIAMLSTNALHFARVAWERAEQASSQYDLLSSTHGRLRAWIERAYPFDISRATRRIFYPMSGSDRSLVFSTSLSVDAVTNHLSRVKLVFDAGSAQLLMSYVPERNNVPEPGFDAPQLLLLDNVKEAHFEYLQQGMPARWVSSWLRKTTLPLAVRLHLVFRDNDSRVFPDLIVRPLIDGVAWCDFDPVSRDCRKRGRRL